MTWYDRIASLLAWRFLPQNTSELIDETGVSDAELAENLRDLARINRLLGGVWLTRWALNQFVHSSHMDQMRHPTSFVHSHQPERWLLDVATGEADIPRAIAIWATQRGLADRLLALDISPQILHCAAEYSHPLVELAAANGMRLPLADRSVELVLCSLALHHFAPDQLATLLGELRRVARRGVILNDIVRSWPGLLGAQLIGALFSRNRLTRHDGPASIRRAYLPAELCQFASAAGLRVIARRDLPGYRVVLVCESDG